MITIDLIDEQISHPEKPDIRSKVKAPRLGAGLADPLYSLAQSHQNELIQAAHAARLLKTNEGTPIDIQRFVRKGGWFKSRRCHRFRESVPSVWTALKVARRRQCVEHVRLC